MSTSRFLGQLVALAALAGCGAAANATAAGSAPNLSTGSLRYNRELGITVTDPAIVSALQGDFRSDYAGGQTS